MTEYTRELPRPNTLWQHRRSGDLYIVLHIANWFGDRDPAGKFPPTVVYRGTKTGVVWSRPLERWFGSFDEIGEAPKRHRLTDVNDQYLTMQRLPTETDDRYTVAALGIGMFAELCHAESKARGWYQDPQTGEPVERNLGEMIALMHSELSEALEAVRKSTMDDKLPDRPGVVVETADLFIRAGDFAAYLATRGDMLARFGADAMDIGAAVAAKMRYNATRHDHSLEARRAAGGKAF